MTGSPRLRHDRGHHERPVSGSPYPITSQPSGTLASTNYTFSVRPRASSPSPQATADHRGHRLHGPVRRPAAHRGTEHRHRRPGRGPRGPARPVRPPPTPRPAPIRLDAWTFHDPDGNYADASGTVADAITPVQLTVTANDQSRPYGTPNSGPRRHHHRLRQRRDPGHQRRDRQPRAPRPRSPRAGQRQPVPDHLQPSAPWPRPTTRSLRPRASSPITAATADIAVTGYTVPYDGQPHTATGTATGARARTSRACSTCRPPPTPRPAAYPIDAWTFHDPAGNYADASGTVADAITAGSLRSPPTTSPSPTAPRSRSPAPSSRSPASRTGDASTASTLASAGRRRHGDGRGLARTPIDASAAVGTGLANYTISYVPGELTITAGHRRHRGHRVHASRTTATPHTATGTATGAQGEDLAGLLDLCGHHPHRGRHLPGRRLDLPRPRPATTPTPRARVADRDHPGPA